MGRATELIAERLLYEPLHRCSETFKPFRLEIKRKRALRADELEEHSGESESLIIQA
jgi:hypothetical protein